MPQFSKITGPLCSRARIQNLELYGYKFHVLIRKSHCQSFFLNRKQTEKAKTRAHKTPFQSYRSQCSSLPVYAFIYNHVWNIYAVFLRSWVGGMYFDSPSLPNEKGNGPPLAVSEPRLVRWGHRGNAFINNHPLLSNRLCSRLCCQVAVGKSHGPYLRMAGSCEREVQARAPMSPAHP